MRAKFGKVKNRLVAELEAGRYGVGERLPAESVLARRFGVATMTLRRGLDELAAAGLIEKKHGKGNFVADRREGDLKIVEMFFGKWTSPFDDEVLHHVCAGISGACHELGMHMFVHTSQLQHQTSSAAYVSGLLERKVGGLLFVSSIDDGVRRALPRGLECVAVSVANAPEDMNRVRTDYAEAGRLATAHLVGRGHRRIGYLGGISNDLRQEPFTGYKAGLAEAGLPYSEDLVSLQYEAVPDEFRTCSGHAEADGLYWFDARLLAEPRRPDAFVVAGRGFARMLHGQADTHGIRLPRDLRFVVIDDAREAPLHTPAWTTVVTASRAMGRTGVELLRDLVTGEQVGPVERVTAPELMVRESCGGNERGGG